MTNFADNCNRVPRLFIAAALSALYFLAPARVLFAADSIPPAIENSAIVNAPLDEVWNAWTTSEGVPTFLGLDARVEASPRGLFRVIFQPDATDPISRGNDGIVVAIEPKSMLSVLWMTPMHMPSLRGNSTSLVLYFERIADGEKTFVRLINFGYGVGPEWREAYAYNVKGWDRVLSSLEYRFENGPIDWEYALEQLRTNGSFPWWRENNRRD